MKKVLILALFFATSYSIQSQEIKYNNWYNGSYGLVVGLDENIPFGVRFALKNFYLDFKSNFGMYANNEPSDYKSFADDYSWVTNTMNSAYQDTSVDNSASVYILNLGLNIPLIKTSSTTFSLFGGPGMYIANQITYDRYLQPTLNDNYYVSSNKYDYQFNLNFGLEIAFKNSIGLLLGIDSKSKSVNAGITLPIIKDKNENSKYLNKLIYKSFSEEIRDVDDFTPIDMIAFFIRDCKRNGIEINRNQIIKAEFVRKYSVKGAEEAVAIAKAMDNDELIDIEIKDSYWDKSSKEKRWYILYHELGHDVLNLKHGEGGVMMFTYPNKANYSWEDFIRDRSTMFKYYKKKNR